MLLHLDSIYAVFHISTACSKRLLLIPLGEGKSSKHSGSDELGPAGYKKKKWSTVSICNKSVCWWCSPWYLAFVCVCVHIFLQLQYLQHRYKISVILTMYTNKSIVCMYVKINGTATRHLTNSTQKCKKGYYSLSPSEGFHNSCTTQTIAAHTLPVV